MGSRPLLMFPRWPLTALGCLAATAALGHAQSVLHTFDGDGQGDRLGTSVACAGDVNGDRVPDIIAGAIFNVNGGTGAGLARIYDGATGAVIRTLLGNSNVDFFGHSVAGAGDVDADGYADVIIGAPFEDPNGLSSGQATVFSGFDGSVLLTLDGEAANDQFGFAVSPAGDLDGDGYDDVLVGAWLRDVVVADTGYARVFSGRDGSVLLQMDGTGVGANFGRSVALAGDVDGDTVPDYVIGAYRTDVSAVDAGSVYVISGATGSTIWTFHGVGAGDQLGYSVAGAGDVDFDGVPDVIAGALNADGLANDGGMARVYSGATGGVLYTFEGAVASDQLGNAVAGAGDVDGDGYDDVVVGAFGESTTGADAGAVRVYSGFDGSVLMLQNGTASTDRYGWSVAGGCDFDGDSLADVLVGARGVDSVGGFDTGACIAFDVGLTGDAGAWTIYGTACAGSGGRVPRVGHVGKPRISTTLSFTLRGAPSNALATLFYGDPQPGPVPLDVIGLIGCTLYVAPYVNLPVPCDANGKADVPVTLTGDVGQIGQTRDVQWVIADPGAPYSLPLTLSDAMELVIGG